METKEQDIFVERSGQYGPLVSGTWWSIGQKSGLTPQMFEAGRTYKVRYTTSAKGKNYIVQILSSAGGSPSVPQTTVVRTQPTAGQSPVAPAVPVGATTGHSAGCRNSCPKCEVMWATKDISIERQAVLKAVLGGQAFANLVVTKTVDEALELMVKMADAGLAWVKKQ